MARAKRPLQDVDPNATNSKPDASNKKRKSADSSATSTLSNPKTNPPTSEPASSPTSAWKWVSRCRPRDDLSREKHAARSASDDSEDDETPEPDYENDPNYEITFEGDTEVIIDKNPSCCCLKPLAEVLKDSPDHIWCTTEAGSQLMDEGMRALYSRCPDDWGMYIYNDFEAYAMIEIQENLIQAFKDAFASRKLEVGARMLGMWAALEAAAYWLCNEETGAWIRADDGDRIGELVILWGSAVVAMVRLMIEQGVFSASGDAELPVRNLRLVLGLWVVAMRETYVQCVGFNEDTQWVGWMARIAREKGGFELGGPVGCEEMVVSFSDEFEEVDEAEISERFDFKRRFKDYAASYASSGTKIGGKEFDIGAMSVAERKRYAFDKKDPLKEGMLPPKNAGMCTR